MKLKYKILITAALIVLLITINLPGIIKSLLHYELVKKYSRLYEIDPLFVLAIIYAESSFIPYAQSHKGAVGLMQILPATFKDLHKELNLKYDEKILRQPDINIQVGIYYLSKLKKEKYIKTDTELLCAYNAGKYKVLSWKKKSKADLKIQDIPYPETRKYVRKVLRVYKWLKKIRP